ncbi:MAG: NAD(P)/FAD-dependent oxidoreductase [Deltaproteobacteria bacterium]|nr:NAD(P)/FAD-dependent oxidoreductase [Deltaproteobacteria bacterium]
MFNVTIIGAGVIGLAVAEELSSHVSNILVVEKNHTIGQETSSRHSGVIHAGIYYPVGFSKARLCREGNRLLYEFCRKRNIPHRRLGKLIVATDDDEADELWKISNQAAENGVTDLSFLSQRQIRSCEPEVRATAALFSPSTGIIDSHSLMRSFYINAESNGAIVVFNSEVTQVRLESGHYEVEINNGEHRCQTRLVVNYAGLHSDKIAALVGINIDEVPYRLKYCKGTYFSVSPSPRLNHLVYPVAHAEKEGLGIHVTVDLGDRIRFGPDTEYVRRLEYTVDERKREQFYQSVGTYLPGIQRESLHPEMSGIRPKLQGPGEQYRDFVIKEERHLGYPGFINLIGIESPGLTASIAIARHVKSLAGKYLSA